MVDWLFFFYHTDNQAGHIKAIVHEWTEFQNLSSWKAAQEPNGATRNV